MRKLSPFALSLCWCRIGKPGDYTTRWVILGIWTCTGLLVTVPNVVHGTDVYHGNTNFCMVFFSSHRAQLTASQGAGSIHSTSSSACWPTMFGWLGSLLSCTLSWPSGFMVWLTDWMWSRIQRKQLIGKQEMCKRCGKEIVAVHSIYLKFILLIRHIAIQSYSSSVSPRTAFRDCSPSSITLSPTESSWLQMPFTRSLVFFCITRPAMVFGIRRDISHQAHDSCRGLFVVLPQRLHHY